MFVQSAPPPPAPFTTPLVDLMPLMIGSTSPCCVWLLRVGRRGVGPWPGGGQGRRSHRTWPCRDNLSDGICFISSSAAASRCRFKVFGNTLFVITSCRMGGRALPGGCLGEEGSACSCRNVVDFICASLLLFVCAAAARRFYLFYFYTHACLCVCVSEREYVYVCVCMCVCVLFLFLLK